MDQGFFPGSVLGTREEMAAFLFANKDLIKRRFRTQLENEPGSLYGSSDFFASMLRRMDGRLASGAIDTDVATFLQGLYLETLLDYARAHRSDRTRSSGAQSLAQDEQILVVEQAPPSDEDRGEYTFTSGLSEQDEQLVRLRAAGQSHQAIASALGLSPAAVRQRWSRLLRTERFSAQNKAS